MVTKSNEVFNYENLANEIDNLPSIPQLYLLNELYIMGKKSPFMNCIRIPHKSTTTRYILHATTDVDDAYGRIYVALPVDTDCDDYSIKLKYKLCSF